MLLLKSRCHQVPKKCRAPVTQYPHGSGSAEAKDCSGFYSLSICHMHTCFFVTTSSLRNRAEEPKSLFFLGLSMNIDIIEILETQEKADYLVGH